MSAQENFHHFGPKNDIRGIEVGTYMKETRLEAGYIMAMHEHTHSHQSLLASGHAILTIGATPYPLIGPCVVEVEAGKKHTLEAVTRVVWFCIHATDETDPSMIDERLTD